MTAVPGKSVAVIGGGLAGLAAACALCANGFAVNLFERKPYLGGRASSYEHPGTGEVVDNCQHVLLGCCTNLIDFYRTIGAEELIRWYDRLTFIEPGGRRSTIATSSLPAPFHTAPSFLRAHALSPTDKLAIGRAMVAMLNSPHQHDNGQTFEQWLKAHGQTDRAIRRFWEPVLVSALNEDADRLSVGMASMVFREAFLKSAEAGRMGVPVVPLTDLYSRAGTYIMQHGGTIHLRTSVDAIHPEEDCVRLCIRSSGAESAPETRDFDFVISAVPFFAAGKLLPTAPEFDELRTAAMRLEAAPITGVHLWFDRQITNLDHAVLLDRTIQWMFHKSRILRRFGTAQSETSQKNGSYVELVVSSSRALIDLSRQQIIDIAVRELAEFFPVVADAKLLKAAVVKEVHATFSPKPGVDAFRPAQRTPNERLFIAGDWTATGWPATMEGAVRSGYLAAQALMDSAGISRQLVAPDLPARGLMRLFA